MCISVSACTIPSFASLMDRERFFKGTTRFQEHRISQKSTGWCSSIHKCLENPFHSISLLQQAESDICLHGVMEAQSRDQACAPQPGGEDVLNVLSPTAQVKNRGDTSRVLSVLSKTKVWSVLDLSRNKNQVLEFYNKVLKKKKIWVAACSHSNNISTQKHPKNYLICIQ